MTLWARSARRFEDGALVEALIAVISKACLLSGVADIVTEEDLDPIGTAPYLAAETCLTLDDCWTALV